MRPLLCVRGVVPSMWSILIRAPGVRIPYGVAPLRSLSGQGPVPSRLRILVWSAWLPEASWGPLCSRRGSQCRVSGSPPSAQLSPVARRPRCHPLLNIVQSIVRWMRFMDKKLSLKLNGGRHVQGILRGFDPFMNLVIDECVEMANSGQQNNIGMVVIRGNSIIMLEALERV
ncbi:small nuclear ribonucleoprotein G isoform X1 [Oryctolagus cuniculus]|uniref:small nuclear ribonucleoprotein G isoform X1 n=3 Tax=Lagomorpha TaxID=9975 RepID=UPI003879287D